MSDGAIASLFVVGIIGYGLFSAFGGGEREGTFKIDDCREVVRLNTDSIQKYFKDFTCALEKSKSGQIISGQCAHIDMSGNVCKTAFIYDKKASGVCKDPNFPHLHYDDLCHSN